MRHTVLTRFTKKPVFIAAAVAALLIIVYLPLLTGPAEFIGDDESFIVNNPSVRQPSLVDGMRDIWTKPMREGEYIPLTVTTFAIEYPLWGLHPKMYRFVNLLIFCLIGMVSYSLALRLNGEDGTDKSFSNSTAALISVLLLLMHPINVESVALIAHRKELLYVLFGLLSVRSYIVGADTPAGKTSTILFLIAAQLSKGAAVVLPLIFVAFELCEKGKNRQNIKRRFPLLIVAAGTTGIIFIIQYSAMSSAGVLVEDAPVTIMNRISGVLTIADHMVKNLLFPLNLSYDYDIPFPRSFPAVNVWILPVLIGIGIGWLVYKRLYQVVFLVMLALIPALPYLNIVPLKGHIRGHLAYFDHYLLFTSAASAPLLTRLLLSLQRRWRYYSLVILSVILLFYAVNSHYLAGFWKTRETLFKRTITASPNLYRAYWALGKAYFDAGKYDDAITALEKGMSLAHGVLNASTYQLLGDAYAFTGRLSEAERYYKLHLSYEPYNVKSVQNLSQTLVWQKKDKEARAMIRLWLVLAPGDRNALETLSLLDKKRTR